MAPFSAEFTTHETTGHQVVRLSCSPGDPSQCTQAAFMPGMGCNLFGFSVGGTEYLCGFEAGGGSLLGTPVLYPTPNRVRDGKLDFEGKTFRFEPNNGPNFIHGLVRDQPWSAETPVIADDHVAVRTHIAMEPGTPMFDVFPICSALSLTYTLRAGGLRLDFGVHNTDAESRLGFGLAIHPYFRIIGPRESVRLQVPAKGWMEAVELLPTGRILDLADGPADLREPVSLAELDLDDVYWGIESRTPQVIYYDYLAKKVTLRAADLFTHSVVYTPQGRPFFCVENQTCSTDAHNLHARGLTKEAHLTILEPGAMTTAWVDISVSDL